MECDAAATETWSLQPQQSPSSGSSFIGQGHEWCSELSEQMCWVDLSQDTHSTEAGVGGDPDTTSERSNCPPLGAGSAVSCSHCSEVSLVFFTFF